MSADDTYIIRYEEAEPLPFVVMWRQNYGDYEQHSDTKDARFATYHAARLWAQGLDDEMPAEYGIVVEDNVPRDDERVRYLRVSFQMNSMVMTKRLLARGTDEQILAKLNKDHPEAHFLQVIDVVELGNEEMVRFID